MSKKSIGQKCAEAIYNWDNRDHYTPPPAIIAQIIDDKFRQLFGQLENRPSPTVSEVRHCLRQMLDALETEEGNSEQYWIAFDGLVNMHKTLQQNADFMRACVI